MILLKPLGLRTRSLIGMNILLIVILLLAIALSSRPQGYPPADHLVGQKMQEQAKSVVALFSLSLEKVRIDTKSLADLTTHIFSHPESYRLSAQPGEYDYDEETGIYGSLHNDGMSVAFLSTQTSLTPALLKEFRLSEYLNPVLQTLVRFNPEYTRINLITGDSLQRSYPWFNFKALIKSGALKKDFQSSNLSILVNANPTHNSQHDVVWDVVAANPPEQGNRIWCAAPIFVGDQFHGAIVTEVNPAPLAKKGFLDSGFQGQQAFLLDRANRVLGIGLPVDTSVAKGSSGTPQALKDLKFHDSSELERRLAGLPMTEAYFGRWSGEYLQVLPLSLASLRLVSLLTPSEAEESVAGESARPFLRTRGWAFWIAMAAGLLLSFNSWWIWKHGQGINEMSKKNVSPFGLPRLVSIGSMDTLVPKALTAPAESVVELPPLFETDELPQIEETVSFETEIFSAETEDAKAETETLQSLIHQVCILSCFDAVGPISFHLSHLCETLQRIFFVQRAIIMLYFQEDRTFRTLLESSLIRGEGAAVKSLEINAERFPDSPVESRNVNYSNAPNWALESEKPFCQIVKKNYMICPLYYQERLLGAVLLVDKDTDFISADQNLLFELQDSLALTLRNLYQCEGLLKIDQLRRQYCLELSRAVESTLDRIRQEVQVIYTRLVSISPLQKNHCDAILFEVGKLMEVVKEVRDYESETEVDLPPTTSERPNFPTIGTEHTR